MRSSCCAYFFIISLLLSVEPSFTAIISISLRDWLISDWKVSSKYGATLKMGNMTLTFTIKLQKLPQKYIFPFSYPNFFVSLHSCFQIMSEIKDKIVYSTTVLYMTGWVECVLTLKANYFADKIVMMSRYLICNIAV